MSHGRQLAHTLTLLGAERPCPRREATVEINVTLGHDSDNGVCVTVADDQTYTPEVVADLLRRAGEEALRLHKAIHPVDVDTDGA